MKAVFSPPTVISVLALMISVSGAAIAANGGIFTLGVKNTATRTTNLTTTVNGPSLQISNSSTGSSATGLKISVPASRPPLVVSSKKKVPNLNADLLDGRDSTQFMTPVAVGFPVAYEAPLATGGNFLYAAQYTATTPVVCDVEAGVQVGFFGTVPPPGILGPFVRGAVARMSGEYDDGYWGFYLASTGGLPSTHINRNSSYFVDAGETVLFGVLIGDVDTAWSDGTSAAFSVGYRCYAANPALSGVASAASIAQEGSVVSQKGTYPAPSPSWNKK